MGEVDWGSVADWFTGILTAGTLFVAVMILYLDRRSKRRASADSLTSWTVLMGTHAVKDKANFTVEVNVYNAGDRPIPFAMVAPGPHALEQWPGQILRHGPIAPGDHVASEVGLEFSWENTPLYLLFTDANGKRWIRSLQVNRYITKRMVRRMWTKWNDHNPYNMLWEGTIKPEKLKAMREARMEAWNHTAATEPAAPVKKRKARK